MSHFDTEPFEQLIGEEEVDAARKVGQGRHGKYQKERYRTDRDAPNGGPEGPARDYAPEFPESSHEGVSMLRTAFDFLIPPADDSPENIRRWRIALGLAVLILFGHVTLACGWLQPIGLSGFAYASDVKEIKITMIEQQIFESRVKQCTAQTAESKQFYAERMQELLRRYKETAGATYPQLPSCAEIQ